MKTLRAFIAALLVAAGLAGVTAAPAGADISDNVRILVRANGLVDIIGDNQDNRIVVCPGLDGSDLTVLIGSGDGIGRGNVEEIFGLTKDLRINMRGGDDSVEIGGRDCEDSVVPDPPIIEGLGHSPVWLPRDLRVTLGSGDDSLSASGFFVGDDMTVLGGSGEEFVVLSDFWVKDRLDVNTSAGESFVLMEAGTVGRTTYRGGNQEDFAFMADMDLGTAPRMLSLSGDDVLAVIESIAEGRVTVNTGNGDDGFVWFVEDEVICVEDHEGGECCDEESEGGCCGEGICIIDGEQEEEVLSYFNVIMGGGNDEAHFAIDLDPMDRIQGSGGNQDFLGFNNPGGATINGFEFFGEPDPFKFLP